MFPVDKDRIDAEDLLESIDDRLTSRVSMRINEAMNSLIARGSQADLDEIQQTIDEILTQVPDLGKPVVQVYRFKHADPDSARFALQRSFDDATLNVDRATDSLIVTAQDKDQAAIATIIEQMDQPGASNKSTKVYQVEATAARRVYPVISELVEDGRVSYDSDQNVVIVTTSAEEHVTVARAIADINKARGDDGKITKVFGLDKERIDAEDVTGSIDERLRSRVSIRTNEAMNSIIVRGRQTDLDQIQQTIDGIMSQVPDLGKPVVKVYRFKHANPRSTRYALREMYDDAVIASDDASDSLIVTASEKDQAAIAAVIAQMDQPGASDKSTRIYQVDSAACPARLSCDFRISRRWPCFLRQRPKHCDPWTTSEEEHKNVAQAIEDINDVGGATKETKVYSLKTANPGSLENALYRILPAASISADSASGSLIVSATAADHAKIANVVAQLDEATGQDPVMKAYPVKGVDAKSVHQSLSSTFAGNSNYSISFQEPTKTLFVVATPKNHEIFAEMLAKMETVGATSQTRTAKVYPVSGMSGEAARSLANSLLQNSTPAATVEIDSNGRSLIVVATEEQHTRVSESLGQMSRGNEATRVFGLKTADPNVIRNALGPLVPHALISGDPNSGSLIVSGSEEDLQKVQDVVAELDTASGQQTVMQAYPIKSGDAKQIHESLKATFNGNGAYSISFQEATKTLFLMATPKNHAVFENLLKELGQSGNHRSETVGQSVPADESIGHRSQSRRDLALAKYASTSQCGNGCSWQLTNHRRNRRATRERIWDARSN